jgi:large subunit ribosomal protein L21
VRRYLAARFLENVMYAVMSSGGKQYRVEPGTTLNVERLAAEPGASVTFDRVLLVADGDEILVGTPLVAGATVRGTVLAEELGPKLVIFKFKQKVKYRRRTGHRQHLTRVRIDAIDQEGRKPRKATPKAEAAPKAETAPKAEAAPAKAKPRATRARTTTPKTKAAASASDEPAKPKPKRTTRAKAAKPKAEE